MCLRFRFRASGFALRTAGFGFRVSGSRVSGFEFSGFGVRASGFGLLQIARFSVGLPRHPPKTRVFGVDFRVGNARSIPKLETRESRPVVVRDPNPNSHAFPGSYSNGHSGMRAGRSTDRAHRVTGFQLRTHTHHYSHRQSIYVGSFDAIQYD